MVRQISMDHSYLASATPKRAFTRDTPLKFADLGMTRPKHRDTTTSANNGL